MRWVVCGVLLACAGCAATLQERALAIPYKLALYEPPMGDSLAGPLAELETRLTSELGVTIDTKPESEMEGTWGMTLAVARYIRILEGLPANARFEVLAHEAGHLFHPETLSRAEREVFAETVMVRVAAFYGSDASGRSAQYLARYKVGFLAMPLLKVDIDDAVRTLTGQAR